MEGSSLGCRVAQLRYAEAVEQHREWAAVGGRHDAVGRCDRLVERADRIVPLRQVEARALGFPLSPVLVVECRLKRIRRAPVKRTAAAFSYIYSIRAPWRATGASRRP